MRLLRAALATFVVVLAATGAMAQGTGGLNIQVVDSNGDPLPGATVTISHEAGNVKAYTVLSDKKGMAVFPVLRPGGGYIVEVSMVTFGTRRETDIRVPIGDVATQVVQLAEEMTERVRVVATQDVVELEKTSSSTKFSDEFVQDLPVPGRFYQNVLTLAPGVNDPDGDGNPTVHGSRSRDFKAVVGGVSNVDPLTGQFMSLVNSDSIEEIEVITGGAGVEFGRAQGGFARIIQKQGTNEFEGTFSLLYRTSALDGTGASDISNLPEPQFEDIQPSLQVSGPLIKDRLWYRLSHEMIDRERPINVVGGIVVQNTEQQIASDQLTWQVSPRNKLAFQLQSDPLKIDNLGVSSSVPSESTLLLDNKSETYSMTWTAPYSPKLLVESTVAWQDFNRSQEPTLRGQENSCVTGSPFLSGSRCNNFETGEVSGTHPVDLNDHSQRLTMNTQATLYGGQFWGMNHQFKFGFSAENERYQRALTVRPDISFFIINPIQDPDSDRKPEPIYVINARLAVPGSTNVRATGTNWSIYAEDQIKPTNNLVITIGGRLDREEINSNGFSRFTPEMEREEFFSRYETGETPQSIFSSDTFSSYESLDLFLFELSQATGLLESSILGNLANITRQSAGFWNKRRTRESLDVSNTNFAPSVSVSWDPWSTGKNKFSFSARRYYDKIFLNIPLIELNPATTDLAFDAESRGNGVFSPTGLRSTFNPAVNIEAVSRDLETPYQDEFRFLYEREIWTETLMKVEYVNRKYRNQLQNQNINHLPGDFGRCKIATPGSAASLEAIVTSPGTGTVTDPYTGLTYEDTDPGDGDGFLDDCVGDTEFIVPQETGAQSIRLEKPDGITDLYIQNPAWGQIQLVGNFNESDYEGFVFELIRRQYRSWEMNGSYTWSISKGNGEDFNQTRVGLDPTLLEDEYGYQSNDQRHVVKLNATTITPWGFRLGGSATWQSGLPYSILTQARAFDAVPAVYQSLGSYAPARVRIQYPGGQRNSERNDSQWLFNMKATKEMNLGRGMNLQVSAEVFNLLNDGTYRVYNSQVEGGFQINGINEGQREFGRSWQLGMKLAF